MSVPGKIIIKGARQHNLKSVDLTINTGSMTVITGVSGSGKSTLAFDTIYAEGQRRYVETFSAYARQFLDRMDKPAVDEINGIPPAIAIEQSNPVRTSRSTVGTMTELMDYVKLLYARFSTLHCPSCGKPVTVDNPQSIADDLYTHLTPDQTILVCAPISVPANFSVDEVRQLLAQQGYTRIHHETNSLIEAVQDRLRLHHDNRSRLLEALEIALKQGHHRVSIYPLDEDRQAQAPRHYSSRHHCASCNRDYPTASPGLFSFNSPIGACETCRGFGRVIGVDYDLVIPDPEKSLSDGAIKPFQTPSNREIQELLLREAKRHNIPTTEPWKALTAAQQHWVIDGEPCKNPKKHHREWFGITGFFRWLESKAYKMHVRVLLSKYRSYDTCQACHGARLKPEARQWRLNTLTQDHPLSLNIAEFLALPIEEAATFISQLDFQGSVDEAAHVVIREIRSRLSYLIEVGLGYLTLDRQTRTLSGGEVQRINLTTALGSSLVNTLFVLDEPSVGLHARDVSRLIGVLHRLRESGNTLLIVEHDPHVILAADNIIDIGPGPGQSGGQIVFQGTPHELLKTKQSSLTALYLQGKKTVLASTAHSSNSETAFEVKNRKHLRVFGASENNLKAIDVRIPLNALVCLAGVSGSGKSTFMRDVLYPALRQIRGEPDGKPGAFRRLSGDKHISAVILVDQSPLAKTTRSVPITVVGGFDLIRALFADQPLAKQHGYKPGTFSFNAGTGRCPTCSGNGFECVEMQFLSDVYLRCSDCNGRRYRSEILAVKIPAPNTTTENQRPRSIADVLEMTVHEAINFFHQHPELVKRLQPLIDVGLGYLQLGQTVPTLSGGESQRLKLAAHLAEVTKNSAGHLFLFDEPTTGLHFDDIKRLLNAFQQLQDAGHSLLVIEHNLDVLAAADWLIELGPEGGDAGGHIVAEGPPVTVAKVAESATGKALAEHLWGKTHPSAPRAKPPKKTVNAIHIHHAREHNLKNISVDIPLNQFTVITGISGSGKSTLAFDILFGEGQRCYLESLNAYARQFIQPAGRPEVDAIHGIPPTVAIEQRTSRGGHKSTVATLTEVYHYLRLLYVKLGTQYCPQCAIAIKPQSTHHMIALLFKRFAQKTVSLYAPLVVNRKGIYNDLAAWAVKNGFQYLRVDGELIPTQTWPKLTRYQEHCIDLPLGKITLQPQSESQLHKLLEQALGFGQGVVLVHYGRNEQHVLRLSSKRACPECGTGFDELDPRLFSYNAKLGRCKTCFGTGTVHPGSDDDIKDDLENKREEDSNNNTNNNTADNNVSDTEHCPDCQGQRLNPTALSVYFRDHSIADIAALSVTEAARWVNRLKFTAAEKPIIQDLLPELKNRLVFLEHVGLGYLNLNRSAPTLSGGEAQRIRLAAQLGSNLQGVCYILDEPTIGLHARDNQQLIQTLKALQEKGNTVVVVEHDEDTIRAADHLIDIGPGAGRNGGHVVASGTLRQLLRNTHSLTAQCLKNPVRHPFPNLRDTSTRAALNHSGALHIIGAHTNNLKHINVEIPLHQLVCVSGVSGSGKSTLIRSIVHRNLKSICGLKSQARSRKTPKTQKKNGMTWHGCHSITGWESIARVMEVDQTPIGKTPRSCPATYIGIWDLVRKVFAESVDARLRGFTASRFSFNTGTGRCASCGGHGFQKVEMNFLPNVRVPCDTCEGWRFNEETRAVRYKDKHIGEVLAMSVEEACEYFSAIPGIFQPLSLLQDMGLGYLTLGQHSPTLSGGEAQRIKLVAELAKTHGNLHAIGQHHLYVLDEPTVGLHMADVEKLIRVLHKLVDKGHSVIVIEHNLDMIAEADWVIDIGPEGGDAGGKVIAQGIPSAVAKRKKSHTAQFLRDHLAR